MLMKKFLLLILCTVIMGACTDKEYDLGKDIDTDNVGIGGPDSEFVMPLANIHVSSNELSVDNRDITALFSDVEALIPGSYQSIEVQQLGDSKYIDQWVKDLCQGMDNDENEFTRVVEYIHKNRMEDFRQCGVTPNNDFAAYKEEFRGLWNDSQKRGGIEAKIGEVVASEIASINTTVNYDCDINNDGLDKDVIDMLVDEQNDGALELFGTVLNKMEPIECTLKAEFIGTSVSFDVLLPVGVASGTADNAVAVPAVTIPANDAYKIIEHGSLRVTVTPVKYYPRAEYHDGEQVLVNLKLRKKGGLKVN